MVVDSDVERVIFWIIRRGYRVDVDGADVGDGTVSIARHILIQRRHSTRGSEAGDTVRSAGWARVEIIIDFSSAKTYHQLAYGPSLIVGEGPCAVDTIMLYEGLLSLWSAKSVDDVVPVGVPVVVSIVHTTRLC